jgi:RNA ligase (TIGR02306 family)
MYDLGWEVVVQKGVFKPGNLCIYIMIDTLIPSKYIKDTLDGETLTRLKTIKLKKQLSQGLILPMSTYFESWEKVDEFLWDGNEFMELLPGDDATELLGIKKYEKHIPAAMQGLIKGDFPVSIPKTDEERLQSDLRILRRTQDKLMYVSMKMDGTSTTDYQSATTFGVCSRNNDLKPGDSVYWQMAYKYNLPNILPINCSLQGEICGPGIQKNPLNLSEPDLFIFNVWSVPENGPAVRMSYPENKQFVEALGLKFVPILKDGVTGSELFGTLEEYLAYANSLNYPSGRPSEGIVVRSYDQKVSFKVVSNRYLLKEEE